MIESVSEAPAAPEFAAATVKAELPHPLVVGVAREAKVNVGNTSVIVSGVAISSGELSAKMKVMLDFAAVTGFAMTSLLSLNAAVGTATAVDVVMDPLVATMFAAFVSDAAAVRVLRSAACAVTLVIIPVEMITVHCDSATSGANVADSVNVELAVAELVPATVKVVVPQLMATGADIVPYVKVGKPNAIESPTSNLVFSLKV